MQKKIILRKFVLQDRSAIRSISCQTAFLEMPVRNFLNNEEILADALTQYYTDYEPESCFVAAYDDKVIGYLVGAKNISRANNIFRNKIMFFLLAKAFKSGLFVSLKTLRLFFNIFISAVRGEFAAPDFSKQYPATLHINIDKNFRGFHVGSRLIDCYLNFLKRNRISGVHFGSISDNAKDFFLKKGFILLHQGRRSYLRYALGQTSNYYIFGKILLNETVTHANK